MKLFTIRHCILFLLIGLTATGVIFTSCDDDDDAVDLIELFSFGPSPALRGDELRFIGRNLDQVSSVVLADNVQVTSFVKKESSELIIVIPEETVTGQVILKTPQSDIATKTILTISEPITITALAPAEVRPGDMLTIQGTYLNLVKEVIFEENKRIGDTMFVSQAQDKIEVAVPEDARTGPVTVSNGEEDPIEAESETDLIVTLPSISQISPNPVKAGQNLTIEGEDLDLTSEIEFGGGLSVTDYETFTATTIVVRVPSTAKDGPVGLKVASLEVVESEELVMLEPGITSITPNPVKPGTPITVTGSDLDLVTSVTFGGSISAEVAFGDAEEITVYVPFTAQEGIVAFNTLAAKSVVFEEVLTLIGPTVTGFNPTELEVEQLLTIMGTDLDLARRVLFTGDVEAAVEDKSETEATVIVPIGAQTGPVVVITANSTEAPSLQELTILASTSVVITSMPSSGRPGEMISIEGENLQEITEIIFPDNVPATMYGQKTSTLIEVVVPLNSARGMHTLIFVTTDAQMFESPVINIQGVDEVDDPSLVFFDFDELSAWWGDTGGNENDPDMSLDGSAYFHVNDALSGWTGFFWRNSKDNFPADVIGTNVDDYVLKFDLNVIDPITGGEFAWRFKGSSGDFWYYWKPWETEGPYTTGGWVTITIPLSDFSDGGTPLTDMSTISEDFGVAFNNGDSFVNATFDNVRFELK